MSLRNRVDASILRVAIGCLVTVSQALAGPPSSITLEAPPFSESATIEAVVGTLGAEDPNPEETFVFELVEGEGDAQNGFFAIEGAHVVLASKLDFESVGADLLVRVKVTNSVSESLEQSFSLTLTDDRTEDADGDGMTQADEEDLHGTSDTAFDSDGDGYGDAFEIANNYSPIDTASPPGAVVIGWGDNTHGQLTPPENLGDVLEIATGATHSLALREDGTVVAWGSNEFGQCDVPADLPGVVSIAAGDRHSVAVLASGLVVAWGADDFEQTDVPKSLANVVLVAAGGNHSLALRRDGTVRPFNANNFGQNFPPGNVNDDFDIVSIAAAADQCHVLYNDGRARTWGRNDFNQTSQPTTLNLGILGAIGEKHGYVLRRNGQLVGWGTGTEGQLSPPPGLGDIVAISSRGLHNLALLSDGSVVAWGSNEFGQTQIPFEARNARRIAAGSRHSLVLRRNESFPEISSPVATTGSIGQPYGYQITVNNATPVAYSAMVLPAGFSIDSQTGLITGTMLDYETQTFRVFADTDRGRLTQVVQLILGDANPPTGITLTPPQVMENAPAGTLVGTLSATDPDAEFFHTFELVTGDADEDFDYENDTDENGGEPPPANRDEDNYRFTIIGNQLFVQSRIDVDFELPHEPLRIRVRVTDSAGGTFQVPFEIELLDDRTEDFDGDGLTEEEEEDIHGTSDLDFDGDGDGIGDGVEIIAGTSPFDWSSWPDYPVVAWGTNVAGGLRVPLGEGITSLSSGQTLGLAIEHDGNLIGWGGSNSFGQRDFPSGMGDVVAMAAGGDTWVNDAGHSLALRADGRVIGWGYNFEGQASVPEGLAGVVEIAAGRNHSLALKQDGTVVAWGANAKGQTAVPAGLADVVAISAGGYQSIALRRDGTLVGWGSFFEGGKWKPVFVPEGLFDVTAVSAGRFHSLALRRDGTVIAWGNGMLGQTAVPAGLTGVVAVAAGGFHSIALKADGTVVSWGLNDQDQSVPPPPAMQDVRLIAAGLQHSIAIRSGPGFPEITSASQISIGVDTALSFPVTVSNALPTLFSAIGLPDGIQIDPVTGVISGTAAEPMRASFRIIVDTDKGRLTQSAWLGVYSGTVPLSFELFPAEVMENAPADTLVGTFSVEDPDEGDSHSFRLVLGEGSDGNHHFTIEAGQLRIGEGFDRDYESNAEDLTIRVRVTDSTLNHHDQVISLTFLDDRTEDADGDGLTEAEEEDLYGTSDENYDSDGDGFGDGFEIAWGSLPTNESNIPPGSLVIAWGSNTSGQSATPIPPGDLVDVAAGRDHCLALKVDGTVIAWGSDEFGQCQIPPTLSPSVAIAAGGHHSLALAADGVVSAWGENDAGQCVVPPGLVDVVAISAGRSHSLALLADGTVVAWGADDAGQSTVPEMPAAAIAVAAGDSHSIALLDNGRVVAWGSTLNGATLVPWNATEIIGIAAGGDHNLAIKSDGTVIAWGDDSEGQCKVPPDLTGVAQVAAGGRHSLARKADGSVIGWGMTTDGISSVPLEASDSKSISAGSSHSLALRHDRPVAEISESSRVRASVGLSVTQPVIVQGATPTVFRALGLPTGISLDTPTGIQEGVISTGEIRSVLLIVDTDQGRLNRILPYNTKDGSPPTAIQLSPAAVMENAIAGNVVGTLEATDPDPGDVHTFALVSGSGSDSNSRFTIEGNLLKVKTGINVDFESPHSDFTIRVRAVDAALNEPFEQKLTIELVNDWSEDSDGNGLSEAAEALLAWAETGNLEGDHRLPGAIPFGDDISNLTKYAFGLDPSVPFHSSPSEVTGLPALEMGPNEGGAAFKFLRRKNRGLVYRPLSSSTLDSEMFELMEEPHQLNWIDDDWEEVVYPLTLGPGSSGRQFFKVEVIIP